MQLPSPKAVLQATVPVLVILVVLNIAISFGPSDPQSTTSSRMADTVSMASNISIELPLHIPRPLPPSTPSPTTTRTLQQLLRKSMEDMLPTFANDSKQSSYSNISNISSSSSWSDFEAEQRAFEIEAEERLEATSPRVLSENATEQHVTPAASASNATNVSHANEIAGTKTATATSTASIPTPKWGARAAHACRPVDMKVIHAGSATQLKTVVRKTCEFDTAADDLVVGVWHSVKTAPRIRWILDSWQASNANVVFLGDKSEPGSCIPNLLATNAGADDFLSTLHKGLVGLQMMLDAYPTKKWFVILGDDTYVDFPNLAEILSAFDSELPYCISEGGFQDRNWYNGFRLNGGAGIITSRKLTQAVYSSMRRVATYFSKERKKLADDKEQHGIVTRWMQRHFFSMHDLVFGNITWAHGFDLTHTEGIYSQNPRFYMPGSRAVMPGRDAKEERKLGQETLRNNSLDGHLYPFPGTFHYITGPFQPWLHIVFSATRQCAHPMRNASISTNEGKLAVGVFYPRGERPRSHIRRRGFEFMDLERQGDGDYSRTLPQLLSIKRAAWVLLVSHHVEIEPSNVRALVADADRSGDVFFANTKLERGGGCLIRRDIFEVALQTESKSKTKDQDDGPVEWLRRRVQQATGNGTTHFSGFVESVDAAREWDDGKCVVTIPLLLPGTTSEYYRSELEHICSDNSDKRDIPSGLCDNATVVKKKGKAGKKEKNLYKRMPCKVNDQVEIIRSLIRPMEDDIEKRRIIRVDLTRPTPAPTARPTPHPSITKLPSTKPTKSSEKVEKGWVDMKSPRQKKTLKTPSPTKATTPAPSLSPLPSMTPMPTSWPSVTPGPTTPAPTANKSAVPWQPPPPILELLAPTNISETPSPPKLKKPRPKRPPRMRRRAGGGAISGSNRVTRTPVTAHDPLEALTQQVHKLYADNSNILAFYDSEGNPERKEAKAEQLIAAKRRKGPLRPPPPAAAVESLAEVGEDEESF